MAILVSDLVTGDLVCELTLEHYQARHTSLCKVEAADRLSGPLGHNAFARIKVVVVNSSG